MIKNFRKEPVGWIALVITVVTVLVPFIHKVIIDTYHYESNFDIRCDEVNGREFYIHENALKQDVSCMFTNNSGQSVSVLSVSPSAYFNERKVSVNKKNQWEEPVYLQDGQSQVFDSSYEIDFFGLKVADSDECIDINKISSTTEESTLRACSTLNRNFGESENKSVLQAVVEGYTVYEYSRGTEVNRLGVIFALGNGKNIHYQPIISQSGFIVPEDYFHSINEYEKDLVYRTPKVFVTNEVTKEYPLLKEIFFWVAIIFHILVISLSVYIGISFLKQKVFTRIKKSKKMSKN